MKRYLEDIIVSDSFADKKMAFLYGPRQVGKTTLAQNILSDAKQSDNYFSWDNSEFKKIWISSLNDVVSLNRHRNPVLVFDEVHKDKRWKNRLKGLYDAYKPSCHVLVTGSARLDFFKRSGDSLMGRYNSYRLHPLTVGESPKVKPPPEDHWLENATQTFKVADLLNLGGFPEPFLGGSVNKAQRWSRQQVERLIHEDLRDLSSTSSISQIELLATLLKERVGSQLSHRNLEQDLQVSYSAVHSWMALLEAVYFCFRIRPYSKNIKRSLLKEPKVYLYNWFQVANAGARFENFVASHLLKSCHYWTDCAMGEFDLFYLRDKDQREVDFLVTKDGKPYLLAEIKSGGTEIKPSTLHFYRQLKPKFAFQVLRSLPTSGRRKMTKLRESVELIAVDDFLSALI